MSTAIKQLVKRKKKLESDITNSVGALVKHFKEDTNIAVGDVDIHILDTTDMRDNTKQTTVGRTLVKIIF